MNGQELKDLCKKKNWNAEKCGELLGVEASTVYGWWQERRSIPKTAILLLERILKLDEIKEAKSLIICGKTYGDYIQYELELFCNDHEYMLKIEYNNICFLYNLTKMEVTYDLNDITETIDNYLCEYNCNEPSAADFQSAMFELIK